jgi:hypothetical protein
LKCPECQKLYRIDTRDIISDSPHFDCIQCGVTFKAESDPKSSQRLITKTATKQVLSQLQAQELSPEVIRRCPKCGACNLKSQTECLKCGIIFEKYERAEKEGGMLPSLVKSWSDLMQDYNNIAKHISFVDQCEDLQAVPFALKKYRELREMQPFDEIAAQMHQKALLRSVAQKFVLSSKEYFFQKPRFLLIHHYLFHRPWKRYFRLGTFILPFVFILWGLFQSHLRNLIGLGVSFLFLRLAVQFFIKGEIKLKDLWKP